jgi:hypothetical protein
MFVEAYKKAAKFTHPVISTFRFYDGTVESGLGTFVILNDEGWIMTAGHILNAALAQQQHQLEIDNYKNKIQEIKDTPEFSGEKKDEEIEKLVSNPKWVTNYNFWWGADGIVINQFHILGENDFAIGKIENYQPSPDMEYPSIQNPDNMDLGKSLCKLGHPFYPIEATFNEATNNFDFTNAKSLLPIPRFPIEGMFTRNLLGGKTKDGKYDIMYIETSSPGLKGQSGGPIFDTEGTIWGIQSRTNFLDLGFSPKIEKEGKTIEENQFLNVGLGVHPKIIVAFLTDNNIKFDLKN